MKYLVIMLALISGLACANKPISNKDRGYIQVMGSGKTVDEAKSNGFKNAIAIIVGSAVLSENEAVNNKLIKEQIIDYSAGYIDNYQIIDRIERQNNITLIMDVIVRPSKIHERVLNQGKSEQFIEGDRIYTQYKSYTEERKSGDEYLTAVLNNFPKNAFSLKQGVAETKVDRYRNGIIVIPYEIKWSYPYLVSINEALGKLQDGDRRSPERIKVISKSPSSFLIGSADTYYFTDSNRANIVKSVLEPNFFIKAKLVDNEFQTLYNTCYQVNSTFAGLQDKGVYVLYGNDEFLGSIQMKIDNQLYQVLQRGYKVELSLTSICNNDK